MFKIKQGDTKTALKATLQDSTGTNIDLSNVMSITFKVVGAGDVEIINRAPDVLDALNGSVAVAFDDSEVKKAGEYKSEFIVVHGDGRIEYFPNDGYVDFNIIPKL